MYSHRNGETELPTQDGVFWFEGDVEEITRIAPSVPVIVLDHTVLLYGRDGMHYLGWFKGQWWGPVTPPWEEQPTEQETENGSTN